MKLMQEKRTQLRNIVKEARYLPITMDVIETGEVSKSCSVRILRSSEKERMVNSGIKTTSAKSITVK